MTRRLPHFADLREGGNLPRREWLIGDLALWLLAFVLAGVLAWAITGTGAKSADLRMQVEAGRMAW